MWRNDWYILFSFSVYPQLLYPHAYYTLQLLVENAVKHNSHSKQQPLHIFISAGEDKQLTVLNNLQQKMLWLTQAK